MTAILWRAREYAALRSIAAALKVKRTALMDRWLNIRTIGPPDWYDDSAAPQFRDAVGYVPAGYALIRRSLANLELKHGVVFFDAACGMGRVLCYVARRPVRRCIGIELNGLAAIATANASSLRGRKADIEIRQQDAAEADYSEGTVYWLYNPFGKHTLQAVLSRIRESLEASPRPIRIVYASEAGARVRFTVSTLVDSRAAVALTVTSVHFGQLLAQPVTISCASLKLAQKLENAVSRGPVVPSKRKQGAAIQLSTVLQAAVAATNIHNTLPAWWTSS